MLYIRGSILYESVMNLVTMNNTWKLFIISSVFINYFPTAVDIIPPNKEL